MGAVAATVAAWYSAALHAVSAQPHPAAAQAALWWLSEPACCCCSERLLACLWTQPAWAQDIVHRTQEVARVADNLQWYWQQHCPYTPAHMLQTRKHDTLHVLAKQSPGCQSPLATVAAVAAWAARLALSVWPPRAAAQAAPWRLLKPACCCCPEFLACLWVQPA